MQFAHFFGKLYELCVNKKFWLYSQFFYLEKLGVMEELRMRKLLNDIQVYNEKYGGCDQKN